MLEWEVLEDEERPMPRLAEERARQGWEQWRPWLVLWVLLLAALVGMFWWRARQQEIALRADLLQAIEAERRVMALGTPAEATDLILGLVDPAAPETWRNYYWYQFAESRAIPEPPRLGTVRLEEEGTLALVETLWTMPNVPDPAARVVVEPRAYRLANGQWRRTPLPVEEVEAKEELQTAHFVLIASPDDLAALTSDPALRLDLEGVWQHIDANWPRQWLADTTIYLNVEPDEMAFLIGTQTSERTILVNSPRFAASKIALDSPLSLQAQYRMRVTTEVIRRLTMGQIGTGIFGEMAFTFRGILDQLQEAEARHAALTDEERRAQRNHWREQLDGAWLSPFTDPGYRSIVYTPAMAEQREQQQLAMSFVLEYLVETEGVEVLGRMAQEMARTRPGFAALCEQVTGLTQAELEARVREYVATVEP
jgi:hypothetical protein